MRLLRRVVTTAGLAIVAIAAATAWWWTRLPLVTLMPAERGPVAEVVYATGVVEPVHWAKVVPLVRGRLVELCGCEGERVNRGDVLARLDDAEARAQAREIDARVELAARTVDRLQELRTRGVATAEAFDRANAEYTQARALAAAQRERIENMVLRAPQSGMVLRLDFRVGEIVATTDTVAWVGQPRPLRIVAEVAEEDIAGVTPGQRVLLRHDGFRGRTLLATVDTITPKGDPVQKTFRAHLSLPDDSPLRIGMSVEANIVLRERDNAVTIPADAVRDSAVFVLVDGQARRRPITIGIRGLRGVEVARGLEAGQRVIAPVPDGLTDGAHVRTADTTIFDLFRGRP
jgi:RND family efflux transporter MFP subunit